MKIQRNPFLFLGVICWGLWAWVGEACAQAEEPVATNEPVVVVEEPIVVDSDSGVTPSATNEVLPVVVEPVVETPVVVAPVIEPPAAGFEPTLPVKPTPAYRGSDMQTAFAGADTSRFGVSGRVNTLPAKKKAKPETGAWRRSLELGMSTASGNTDTLRYDGALKASKETESDYFYLKAAGRYGESDGEKDTQNALGEAKFQHRLTERVYAALDGNVLHDPIADLTYRARGSLSLGRRFIWSERTVLSAEAGPGYVAEEKADASEQYLAGRLAQYLEFLVTASLQIWQSVEYVPSLEDAEVYFINSEVGLETVLISNLSLRFTVEDRYDNSPAEGKERNDLTTTTVLVLSF